MYFNHAGPMELTWHKADTWWSHARPRGCLHGSLRGAQWLGWQMTGPGVSGPRLEYWGVLGPFEWRKGIRGSPVIYPLILPLFLRVGLCSLYFFPYRTRGSVGCIGCNRDDWDALIGWTQVHAITINAYDEMHTVDRLSEILQLRLNHVASCGFSHEDWTSDIFGIVGSWPT